jgi:hypothetical protein
VLVRRLLAEQERASTSFLHDLSPSMSGELAEAIAAVHDRVERGHLSVAQYKVAVCRPNKAEEERKRSINTFVVHLLTVTNRDRRLGSAEVFLVERINRRSTTINNDQQRSTTINNDQQRSTTIDNDRHLPGSAERLFVCVFEHLAMSTCLFKRRFKCIRCLNRKLG